MLASRMRLAGLHGCNGHEDILETRACLALDSQIKQNKRCLNVQGISSSGYHGLRKTGGYLIIQNAPSCGLPG